MIKGLPYRTDQGGFQVFIDNRQLDPRPSQKLYNHSPDGFAWGYTGSGPSQLALALLLHFTDEKFAQANYQHFKFDIIAQLPPRTFTLRDSDVTQWAERNGYAKNKTKSDQTS